MDYSRHSKKNEFGGRVSGQSGFTLIELMTVVAIIGFLAAIAIPAYGNYIVRAKLSEGLVLLSGQKPAIGMYYSDNGSLPKTFEDIGLGSSKKKGGNRRRDDFQKIFGFESKIWATVTMQSRRVGRGKDKATNLNFVLRSYRRPAWDNLQLILTLQVKPEEAALKFRCVINRQAKYKPYVPSNCRDGDSRNWDW